MKLKRPHIPRLKPGKKLYYFFVAVTVVSVLILVFGFPIKKIEKDALGFRMIKADADSMAYRSDGVIGVRFMNGYDGMIDVKEVVFKTDDGVCRIKTPQLANIQHHTYFEVIARDCPGKKYRSPFEIEATVKFDRHISYSKIHREETGILTGKVSG